MILVSENASGFPQILMPFSLFRTGVPIVKIRFLTAESATVMALSLALIVGPWAPEMLRSAFVQQQKQQALSIENAKCIPIGTTKTCETVGISICGSRDNCANQCNHCESNVNLPNMICIPGFSGKSCIRTDPRKDFFCGKLNFVYKGDCKKLDNNCDCVGSLSTTKCGNMGWTQCVR
jgi:hypothetical protein